MYIVCNLACDHLLFTQVRAALPHVPDHHETEEEDLQFVQRLSLIQSLPMLVYEKDTKLDSLE